MSDVKEPTQEEVEEHQREQDAEYRFKVYKNAINGEFSVEILTKNASMLIPFLMMKQIVDQLEEKMAELTQMPLSQEVE